MNVPLLALLQDTIQCSTKPAWVSKGWFQLNGTSGNVLSEQRCHWKELRPQLLMAIWVWVVVRAKQVEKSDIDIALKLLQFSADFGAVMGEENAFAWANRDLHCGHFPFTCSFLADVGQVVVAGHVVPLAFLMSDGYRAVLPTCKKVIWLVLPPVLINLRDRKTFLLDAFASPWESPGCSAVIKLLWLMFSLAGGIFPRKWRKSVVIRKRFERINHPIYPSMSETLLTRSVLSVHWKSSSTVRSFSPIQALSWPRPLMKEIDFFLIKHWWMLWIFKCP